MGSDMGVNQEWVAAWWAKARTRVGDKAKPRILKCSAVAMMQRT